MFKIPLKNFFSKKPSKNQKGFSVCFFFFIVRDSFNAQTDRQDRTEQNRMVRKANIFAFPLEACAGAPIKAIHNSFG